MPSSNVAQDFEDPEVSPSPFRAAFGRARIEALSAAGPARESLGAEGVRQRPEFRYRLLKRRGKRSAEEDAWNRLGRKGWELVGVTSKHAAFKRRANGRSSRP